jgi:hypothetical protein
MRKHVDLLGLLHIVCGVLGWLVGLAFLGLAGGAAALAFEGAAEGGRVAAGVTAALFGTVAGAVLGWGGLHVWIGAELRRHRPWARLAALAVALMNLFVPPLGTALGAYSLWVLLNEQSRQLFEPALA